MLSRMLQALMLVAVMLSITPAYAADPAPAEKVEKVVWHVDFADPRRLSAMIQSVNNMVTAYQNDLADYDVRVVFVGAGIRFLTKDPLAGTAFAEDAELTARRGDLIQRLEQLRDVQKVKLELCEITASRSACRRTRSFPACGRVPSGVVRIAELEHRGYVYLKQE